MYVAYFPTKHLFILLRLIYNDFRNEKERQLYWKKKHLENLAIDNANSEKLSKAFHNISFGDIEPIKDTRSLKEREDDDLAQMSLAKKNAMILLSNDGAEAEQLLRLIGKADYKMFNRYAQDIIQKLSGQIGKMRAHDVLKEVQYYITREVSKDNKKPPTAEQLDHLIHSVSDNFDSTNATIRDILNKLEAYKTVVNLGDLSRAPSLPLSGDDVSELTDVIEEKGNDESEIIHSLNVATADITREALDDMVEVLDDTVEVLDEPRSPMVLYRKEDDSDEDDEDDQSDYTVSATHQLHESLMERLSTSERENLYKLKNEVESFITDNYNRERRVYDFKDVPKETVDEMKKNIRTLLSYADVSIRGGPGLTTLAELYNSKSDDLYELFSKILREKGRDTEGISDAWKELLGGMSDRVAKKSDLTNREPSDIAREVITTIKKIRAEVGDFAPSQFKTHSLYTSYNLVRFVVTNKPPAPNIKSTTVLKEINSHLYDYVINNLEELFLSGKKSAGSDSDSGEAEGKPHSLSEVGDLSEDIYKGMKKGAGLRFKNGRFKRF